MHLLLTDVLTCARCGPDFGLVLMADELADRRVLAGRLGCPNCRELYPVRDGFADLRPAPRHRTEAEADPGPEDPEAALRLAAMLGVREGPGFMLLAGDVAREAGRLAAMIPEMEIVAVHPGLGERDEEPGVSRMELGATLPFRSASMRGVALQGASAGVWIPEAVRVLGRGGRLVLVDAGSEGPQSAASAGLEVVLATDRAVVAVH